MLIDGEKWACEACVRGHRVTTCKHHDRPLIRINRKGRPFSTCSVCNCTPCEAPEEHAKLKREAEVKSHSSKRAAGRSPRLTHSGPSTFLPIAPRPSPPSSAATAANPPPPPAVSDRGTASPHYHPPTPAPNLPAASATSHSIYLSPSLPPSFCSMATPDIPVSLSMVSPLDAHRIYSDMAVSFADSTAIYALDGLDVDPAMLPADVFQEQDWGWLGDDVL
ncbi:hypothetical protein ASPCADRAFT_133227 [Aspergillus carbonarius ITEM 5010]|uniref:Copper-fist domain-containing protein n=1 Tax=Aspergillus carbonarius (strain ITEM 5010) TaxID=602072 RepID=A0A1R3REB8_ASPC5|nr:hypothetical protein ASPCADRAFT_133227 [Aspergillus carbonarius ITEM 5010]